MEINNPGGSGASLTVTDGVTTLLNVKELSLSGATVTDGGGGIADITITGGGSGTVTTVSVVSANGFAGTVANATTTPAITLSTTITGILQGNGTAISAATTGNLTESTSSVLTIGGGTGALLGSGTTIQVTKADSTHSGYLSSTDWVTFNSKLSGNQTITLSGDVTGSGATAITTAIAAIAGTTVIGTTGSTNVVFSTSPTLTNPVVGTQSASDNSTKAASTAYVTTAINNAISAVNPAVAVQAATTAAADTSGFAYTHVAGIGDFFTGSVATAVTIDGFTFTALGQRLLVKNDTQSPSGAFNGIYYVTQLQTALLAPILTRALDFDQPSDINNTGAIPVVNGTVNGTTSWVVTSTVNTVGTDPITFAKFSVNPSTIITSSTSAGGDLTGTYPNPTIASGAVSASKMATNVKIGTVGCNAASTTGVSTGQVTGFFTIPYSGTITAWEIGVDAGTVTFQVWKVATGTATPTSGNSISTSGVSLSSGTYIRSTTLTDFTTTTVTAGDIFAFNISAVSGVKMVSFQLGITKS